MVEDIVSIPLPVEETFRIRKNVIRNGEGKRVCVVTGIHGDELEGQYVCFLLTRILNQNPELLHGSGAKVTRLAFGLPVDSGIAYSDPLTLRRAIANRILQ